MYFYIYQKHKYTENWTYNEHSHSLKHSKAFKIIHWQNAHIHSRKNAHKMHQTNTFGCIWRWSVYDTRMVLMLDELHETRKSYVNFLFCYYLFASVVCLPLKSHFVNIDFQYANRSNLIKLIWSGCAPLTNQFIFSLFFLFLPFSYFLIYSEKWQNVLQSLKSKQIPYYFGEWSAISIENESNL